MSDLFLLSFLAAQVCFFSVAIHRGNVAVFLSVFLAVPRMRVSIGRPVNEENIVWFWRYSGYNSSASRSWRLADWSSGISAARSRYFR